MLTYNMHSRSSQPAGTWPMWMVFQASSSSILVAVRWVDGTCGLQTRNSGRCNKVVQVNWVCFIVILSSMRSAACTASRNIGCTCTKTCHRFELQISYLPITVLATWMRYLYFSLRKLAQHTRCTSCTSSVKHKKCSISFWGRIDIRIASNSPEG